MAKTPKNPIVHDDENMTVKVIDSGIEETEEASGESGPSVGVPQVEKIKLILQCEENIAFQRETIASLKKKLAEELHTDAGFVAELINVVKKEMDPEKGGGVIEKKNKVLGAAEQAVVLYPNVKVPASLTLEGLLAEQAGASPVTITKPSEQSE